MIRSQRATLCLEPTDFSNILPTPNFSILHHIRLGRHSRSLIHKIESLLCFNLQPPTRFKSCQPPCIPPLSSTRSSHAPPPLFLTMSPPLEPHSSLVVPSTSTSPDLSLPNRHPTPHSQNQNRRLHLHPIRTRTGLASDSAPRHVHRTSCAHVGADASARTSSDSSADSSTSIAGTRRSGSESRERRSTHAQGAHASALPPL